MLDASMVKSELWVIMGVMVGRRTEYPVTAPLWLNILCTISSLKLASVIYN